MLRIVSYIEVMRWLCLCLLISLPALLAGPAHTSTPTVPQIGLAVDTDVLSEDDIGIQLNSALTRNKTREFANWLSFASVPDAINLIHGLIADPQLSMVQKEAVLHRLTQHLRTSAPGVADKAVMLELTGYQSQVLTHHHDDPRYTQPAFNIAASAQGALNEWRLVDISQQLESTDPLQMWNQADSTDRRLILTALRTGHGARLEPALMQSTHPELAAASALGSRDLSSAVQIAGDAPSAAALDIVKNAIHNAGLFSAAGTRDILLAASQHADPVVAGLAMHELALRETAQQAIQPDVINTLISQLPDPAMGASAAMTLARVLSDDQLQNLRSESDPDNKMLQARIKLIRQLRGELQ